MEMVGKLSWLDVIKSKIKKRSRAPTVNFIFLVREKKHAYGSQTKRKWEITVSSRQSKM